MVKRKIPVQRLKFGMYVTELDRPWEGTPFVFKGFAVTSLEQINALQEYCKTVYIDLDRDVSVGGSETEGQAVIGTAVYKEVTPVEQELVVAKEVFSAYEQTIRSSLDSVRTAGKLDPKPLTDAVSSMTRSIERNPDAMMLLFRIKQSSGQDFDRAVETSIHMITFGRFLQFSSKRLELLGLAGLLLDIGKIKLPDAILHKQNTLSREEFESTKAHVMQSIELIHATPGLPKGLEDIVLQHHERQDGSGYPQGLQGRQITIDGAIAGLANSYTAITSKRPYAEQFSPSDALNMLYKLRGKLFHEALVEQFIQCIGIYPVGSTVELNTGEVGVVIAQNLVRRLKPRVMVILDASWHPIHPQVILDLVKEPKANRDEPYQIRRTLPRDQLPINPADFFF
jgi:HD-GYP domain-containing protein (c-di-GMP phosphodiesterase class II)